MNIALAICHKHCTIATLWAQWIAALGGLQDTTIFLTFDQKVPDQHLSRIHHILKRACKQVHLEIYFGHDPGYPGGANRMFVATMRRASEHGEGKPILWTEVDAIPMRPGWFAEIRQEYAACGKPFLGPILHTYDTPHMNGTGVYPANWEQVTNITACPDNYPWDTYCRKTIAPKASPSKLMVHKFRGNKAYDIEKIAIFHPDKTTNTIRKQNKKYQLLPNDAFDIAVRYVLKDISDFNQSQIQWKKLNMTGCFWSIAKLTTLSEITRAEGQRGVQFITEQEYNHYLQYT